MTAKLYVQIWQDGVCLQEIPFTGERLQVGRLPDNDVVINHLSVSRTHALLERAGDQVTVEDLGSQNGIWVGEQRLDGRTSFEAGASVRIGQHELRFTSGESSVSAEAGAASHSEAETATEEGGQTSEDPMDSFAIDEGELATPEIGPLDDGVELGVDDLFGPEEDATSLVDDASGHDLVRVASTTTEVPALSDPEIGLAEPADGELSADDGLFDGMSGEPIGVSRLDESAEGLAWGSSQKAAAPEGDDADTGTASETETMYAGLIVQRGDTLVTVLPWDQEEMFAGRGSECEILLAEPEVSRKHAVFARRMDGSYLVRDLGSINGVFVNDEKVDECVLAVGDIVRIESFALTFLLDHQPIGSEVQAPTPPPAASADLEKGHMTVLGELPPLDASAPPMPTSGGLPSLDLMDEDDADADKDESASMQLELEVSLDELPEPLARAFRELGDRPLRLPVTLRVRS